MAVTVSATEARVRFGEMMRRAVVDGEAIVVERGGDPAVVVVSLEEYRRLLAAAGGEDWRAGLDRAVKMGQRIRARRGGASLTPSEELMNRQREERGDELVGMR